MNDKQHELLLAVGMVALISIRFLPLLLYLRIPERTHDNALMIFHFAISFLLHNLLRSYNLARASRFGLSYSTETKIRTPHCEKIMISAFNLQISWKCPWTARILIYPKISKQHDANTTIWWPSQVSFGIGTADRFAWSHQSVCSRFQCFLYPCPSGDLLSFSLCRPSTTDTVWSFNAVYASNSEL